MHDATSKMEGMYHVNKTMCHEEGIHCVNGSLGHMGMERKDMAMQRRINQTMNMGACMHVSHACEKVMGPRARACERGLSPHAKRTKVNPNGP